MPRILLALFVALIAGVFATPASAHVHGTSRGESATVIVTEAAAPTAVKAPSGTAAIPRIAVVAKVAVAKVVAAASSSAPCEGDCGHGPDGCSCMTACIALALPDLPTIAPTAPAAGPHPGVAAAWRPTELVPPTPPPRA